MKEVCKHGIDLHVTEPDRHNHSKVEGVYLSKIARYKYSMGVIIRS